MINFIKKQDNYFSEGLTQKGTHIFFVEVPEHKLNFHNHDCSIDNQFKTPTELVIYSNITISETMLEDLEKSRLIKVIELCNSNQQIVAYPLIGFNYDKLKSYFFEFIKKFNL